MLHLTPEELVDLAEGRLARCRSQHGKTCRQCCAEADELRILMVEARQVGVPEPSPLFLSHLSVRIANAVESSQGGIQLWWGQLWGTGRQVLTVATLSVLLVVTGVLSMLNIPVTDRYVVSDETDTGSIAWLDETRMSDELDWSLVVAATEAVEWQEADTSGWIVDQWTIDGAVSQLSAIERRELVRLLEGELGELGL